MPEPSTETLARALGSIVADFRREMFRDLEAVKAVVLAEAKAGVAEAEVRREAMLYDLMRRVDDRLAQVKDGEPGPAGRDGKDGLDGRDGADGKDGASVTLEDVLPVIEQRANEYLAALPVPKDGVDGRDGKDGQDGADGKSVTLEDVLPALQRQADDFLSRIRAPKDGADGKDGTSVSVDDVLPDVQRQVAEFLAAIPATKDGEPGRDGMDGAPGRDGIDGKSVNPRGTFDPEAEYAALDIVALNGGSFIAVKDVPGPCPGAGWQLLTSRGSRGERGERGLPGRDGLPGERGLQGPPGEGVVALYPDGAEIVLTTDSGRELRTAVPRVRQ